MIYQFKSYAKLNLNLYVGPPEDGGLHRLSSVFQAISLFDSIELKPNQLQHSIKFIGMDVPLENTCSKVLDLLGSRLKTFWNVEIKKNIPNGAGLGGGSSNAATLILALNLLDSLNLSLVEMEKIAIKVGSDVPFFLHGAQALVTGTGNIINPNQSLIKSDYFVLILPGIHCSTASVYGALDSMGQFDDLDQLDSIDLCSIGINRLLKPACFVSSELLNLYDTVNGMFPNQVFMSGSGSTLFIPCFSTNFQAEIKKVLEAKLVYFDAQITAVNAVN